MLLIPSMAFYLLTLLSNSVAKDRKEQELCSKNPLSLSSPSFAPVGVCDQTQASLKEENDSLRWQLDAYRNEVDLLRKEQIRNSRPDEDYAHSQTQESQLQLLQQSMHSMQQVGIIFRNRISASTLEFLFG